MKKLLFIIPLLIIFSGCNDYKELNNIAIVSGMSIDKKNNKYNVHVLVANSKNNNGSQKEGMAGNAVYGSTGHSLSEAIKNIDNKLPKQIYLGHLGVVIISEDIAKKDTINITDYFFRNPETTKRFYILMTRNKEKASNVLKILSPLESYPFQNIKLNIENSKTSGSLSDDLTYSEFLEKYLNKGIDTYIPTVRIYGDVKKASSTKILEKTNITTYISVSGLALFKGSNFIDYSSKKESKGINLALGNSKELLITNKCNEGNIVTIINNIKTKKSIKSNYIYDIKVTGTGDIEETSCDINLNKSENIKLIEKKINKKIKSYIKSGINITKKYNTDTIGFGNLLYKKNPNKYQKIYNKNYLKKIKVNISVNIKIKNKGSIKQSIKKENNNE